MALPLSPSFASPPLEEVALAVQFQPEAIDLMSVAAFAQALGDDFPRREERPAQPPMQESFAPVPEFPFRFEMVGAAPQSRLWFLPESGTRLVQLQHDLIAYNWRRAPDGAATNEDYPRYSTLRRELERRLSELEEIIRDRKREALRPNWCEVTYINHIGPMLEHDERPRLDELLRGVSVPEEGGFLPGPEGVALNLRFLISGDDGAPRGRLTVGLATALRNPDQLPIWVMTLTARVMGQGEESAPEALNTLDIGHDWVVNAFAELTSDQMHEIWGRLDHSNEGETSASAGS